MELAGLMVSGARDVLSVVMVQCSCPAASVVDTVEKYGEEMWKW